MRQIDRAILAEIHIQPQTLRELAAATNQTPHAVATTLDSLIAKGLARKTMIQQDGKRKKAIAYAEYSQLSTNS